MQSRQERLEQLVSELWAYIKDYFSVSRDAIFRTFASGMTGFLYELKKNIHQWSALGEDTLNELKAGSTTYLLDLELVNELACLLLDEFGEQLQTHEIAYIKGIRSFYQEIRSLINDALDRPGDTPLATRLDLPATRQKLGIELDRILITPVNQAIDGVQKMLGSNNLSDTQRQDLNAPLNRLQHLARVLQTARPLIEAQNFRALAMLSHEYRSPFCGITGFFEVLLKIENEGLTDIQLDQLRDLISYSQTIIGLLNDLMDATKLLIGTPPDQEIESTELALILKSVTKWLDQFGRKYPQVSVQMQIPDVLPCVMVDPIYLRISLMHLILNALKYTPKGVVCLDAVPAENYVLIRVQDTGIGIPQDQQEHIFEPFTQVGEQSKGLGLGLFLVRHYVELFKGTVTVESQVGVGSTFTVRVPIAK